METQRVPDITGLEVFQIEVNGDDPRWSRIKRFYKYQKDGKDREKDEEDEGDKDRVRTGDFPVKPGKRIVRYVLLPPHPKYDDVTYQTVIDDIARRNLTRPDRAVTETILDARKTECIEKHIGGICGVIQTDALDRPIVGCIDQSRIQVGWDDRTCVGIYRGCHLFDLAAHWCAGSRYHVAVVSEEPV